MLTGNLHTDHIGQRQQVIRYLSRPDDRSIFLTCTFLKTVFARRTSSKLDFATHTSISLAKHTELLFLNYQY
jgi:hypothetical protein